MVQRVRHLLHEATVQLDLVPGVTIDKVTLCERLGVSRFVVAEALGRLADEGFVELLPQGGMRVARINLADCRQTMFMRRALEVDAVRALVASRDLRRASPHRAGDTPA